MAWIEIVPAEEAAGDLKTFYDMIGKEEGPANSPFEGMTMNGPALLKLMEFSMEGPFGESPVSHQHREMIATYVSGLNHCVF